jgi:hypothetical protein
MEKFIHLGDPTVPRGQFFVSPPFSSEDREMKLQPLPTPDAAYQDIYGSRPAGGPVFGAISEVCNSVLWDYFAESCASAILDSKAKSANITQAYIFLPVAERDRVLHHGFEPTHGMVTTHFHLTLSPT